MAEQRMAEQEENRMLLQSTLNPKLYACLVTFAQGRHQPLDQVVEEAVAFYLQSQGSADEVNMVMQQDGIIDEVPLETPYVPPELVQTQGEPLSQLLLENRR